MNKETIIQGVIDKIKAKTYLEIGVEKGINFFTVRAPFKVAVDPHFRFGRRHKLKNIRGWFSNHYFEKTSDRFFEDDAPHVLGERKIDVAFVDGLHTYAQSLEDFNNCLKYLSPDGIIMLHDCNPLTREAAVPVNSPAEMYAMFPNRSSNVWNGDVWKTILHLRTSNAFQVFVLDCDHGIGVVRRAPQATPFVFSIDRIPDLDYNDFELNRGNYLNLKSPEYLGEFLATL